MAEVNRNFPFRVVWRGRYAAGFLRVSPFPQELTSTRHRVSGSPPPAIGPEGQNTPFFISLERGIAFDLGFEQWISMVRSFGPATGKGSLLPEYKQPLTIEIYDEKGEAGCAYHLARCWVAEYKAVPSPDPGSHEIAIEHLKIGFEKWERDLLKKK